jgi:hypothetical protein
VSPQSRDAVILPGQGLGLGAQQFPDSLGRRRLEFAPDFENDVQPASAAVEFKDADGLMEAGGRFIEITKLILSTREPAWGGLGTGNTILPSAREGPRPKTS